jgi:demethoxyubiquinone hydroxylase (CLK1/Coq7/Cat5 family)
MISPQLQRALVLGELADLFLYRALLPLVKTEGERTFLRELAQTEEQHVAFWNERFSLRAVAPDVRGRLRNAVLWSIARVGGAPLLWLIVEAVEVSGIKKYLHLWEQVKDHDVREGLRTILEEELHHEDHAVTSQSGRKISPENIRNAFLGFNDGSVEILGAVSGFAAAFADPVLVAMSANMSDSPKLIRISVRATASGVLGMVRCIRHSVPRRAFLYKTFVQYCASMCK